MSIARGKYILFVDGDDWLEIDSLDKLYKNKSYNIKGLFLNEFIVSI